MAVRVVSHVTNMTKAQYEGAVAQIGALVQSAPGFIAHASWVDENGAHVEELWESREAYDAWFDGTAGPAMQQMQLNVETQVQPIATLITPSN